MIPVGKVIQGYRVDRPMTGGGKSETAQATKLSDGSVVFLKRFMSPKFPVGETDANRRQKAELACQQFEERHRQIMASLDGFTNGSGHLVKPIDFFRVEASYYKVYPFVSPHDPWSVSAESLRGKEVFVKTLALSLRELHARDIVHCDLKPDNVLVHRANAGSTAKLIDFDEAFFVGDPPRDGLSGDPNWFSPERQLVEDEQADPSVLSLASDVFTFVLLVHRLVNGKLPEVAGADRGSLAERVMAGGVVQLTDLPFSPPAFNAMARQALSTNPTHRPSIEDMCLALGLPPGLRSRVKVNRGR